MDNKKAKKLTISGFKSFADTVTLDLDGGLICVADPAGNGVADICDALCFLTGRPAPAGRDLNGMLFAGDDVRRPAVKAEVTLVMEGPDGKHAVTRVLEREGQNHFLIDGEEKSVSEIREAVSGSGIYGYSLLDQNVAADVIYSRHGSLEELISRASGSADLKRGLIEKEAKREDVRRELETAASLLEESKKKKKELVDETLRVNDYHLLNEQLKTNEINIILRRIEQCDRNNYTASIQISEIEERLAGNEKERAEIQKKIQDKKDRLRELDAEDADNRDMVLKALSDINDRKSEVSVYEGKIDTVTANIDTMNEDLMTLRGRAESEQQSIRDLEKEGVDIAHNAAVSEKKQQIADETLRTSRKALSDKLAEYEETKASLDAARSEFANAKARIEGLEKLKKNAEGRRESILNAIEIKEEEIPDEASHNSDIRKRDALTARREQTELRKNNLEKELADLSDRVKELTGKRDRALNELTAETSRRDVLSELDRNYDGYSAGARTLLTDSSLSGIYGTVGELLSVARGYENVIATALGSHVQDIVCSDRNSAVEAARFLKAKNAGRLTFIPVKDLEYKYVSIPEDLLKAEGCVGKALDFVDFSPEYTRAFDYLLGGTVIFRTTREAEAAGLHENIRMVTLENDILNDSRVIKGGSIKDAGSRIFERKESLRRSQARAHELETEYESLQSEYLRAVDEEKALRKSLNELETGLKEERREEAEASVRAELDGSIFSGGRRDVSRLRTYLSRSDEEASDLPAEIKSQEKKRDEAEAEIRQLKQATDVMYQEIEKLRSQVRDQEKDAAGAAGVAASYKNDLTVNELTIEKNRNILDRFETDIKKRSDVIEREKQERAQLLRDKETLEQNTRIMEMNFTEKRAVLSKFREELDSLRTDLDRLATDKENADMEYYSFGTEKRALEVQRDSESLNADRMKKNLFETYGVSYNEALADKDAVFALSEGLRESGRIRNSLAELGSVNIGAPEELEKVKARVAELERSRSRLEDEITELDRDIASLRTKTESVFTNYFNALNAEFKKIFASFDTDTKAYLRMDELTGTADIFANILIRRPAHAVTLVANASYEDKSLAFVCLAAAMYRTGRPALIFMDNLDRVIRPEDLRALVKRIGENDGESLIWVTGREENAADADRRYAYRGTEGGNHQLQPVSAEEYGNYTQLI